MALNWTMLDESKRPLPLPEEHTVMTVDKGAEVAITIPESGGSLKKLKETGRIWLTEQRVRSRFFPHIDTKIDDHRQLIFVTAQNLGIPSFESLSIPLASLLSTSFVQPTFGANYLTVDIRPSPEGGLTDGTKAEIRLKDQAMFGFVSALEKVRERALFMKRESALEDELRKKFSSPSKLLFIKYVTSF
jgi:hypothetical protein